MTFDVSKAQQELSQKSLNTIQVETAFTWGSRALAAWNNYQQSGQSMWLVDAGEYYHEAMEHAALAGHDTYLTVHKNLDPIRQRLGL